ncbi:Embryonic polyadenylate-binding protein 2-A [Podila verticillata]|nr:Embryonic polyadenylate-binding protein 2-A [Podila verticillata]
MTIIHKRCPHRHEDENQDDDTASVCSFSIDCANRPYDLRQDIERMKDTNHRIRKSPKQIYKNKKQNKDLHSIHITNLNPATTIDELKRAFKSFGPILSATIACSFKNGKSTGHAYLEFNDVESMVKAARFDRTLLHSRMIRVVPKCGNYIAIVRGAGKEQAQGLGHGHEYGQERRQNRGRDDTSGRAFGRDIFNTNCGRVLVAHPMQLIDPEGQEKCHQALRTIAKIHESRYLGESTLKRF